MRKTCKSIFPEKRSLDVSLGPTEKRQYPKFPPPPPQKKNDFFSDWVGLFEICFRASEMTDPRPCPRGWAYFRVLSCSTETCQAQTNKKLSAAQIYVIISEKQLRKKHPPPDKRLSVMTSGLITFYQVRSRF